MSFVVAGLLRDATSYETLLAIGVSLCLLGIVLRGFHQGNLRAAAARRQKARMNRVAGIAAEPDDAPLPSNWIVRHLPWCYRGAVVLGVALMVVALLRR
jgi:hypothetical protein